MSTTQFEYYDDEERELIESVERGEWQSVPITEEYRKNLKQSAARTLRRIEEEKNAKKDKNMNIRIASKDIEKIRERAKEAGIPYQTLAGMVLHQFAIGKIKVTV